MPRSWRALNKAAEECNELGVELMKLSSFPDGKHPGRKKSLIISTEDECADVLAAVNFFIDRNKLDRTRIEARQRAKYLKFSKWWPFKTKSKKKIASSGQSRRSHVALHVE